MENTIQIPKFLHEVHGEQSNWTDILTVHILAGITVMATLFAAVNADLVLWQLVLLSILAYDLGGGVLANFTYSTKWYYDQSTLRRLVFLSLHVLQPLLMMLVFPAYWMAIAAFSVYTLVASFLTNSITRPQQQLLIGVFLSLTGIIALHTIPFALNTPLQLLLNLFLLKLPLSFSVRWYRLKKFKVVK